MLPGDGSSFVYGSGALQSYAFMMQILMNFWNECRPITACVNIFIDSRFHSNCLLSQITAGMAY